MVILILIQFSPMCHSSMPFCENEGPNKMTETFLVVHWLRIHLRMAEGMGSTFGWGTKIPHAVKQLRLCTATT